MSDVIVLGDYLHQDSRNAFRRFQLVILFIFQLSTTHSQPQCSREKNKSREVKCLGVHLGLGEIYPEAGMDIFMAFKPVKYAVNLLGAW